MDIEAEISEIKQRNRRVELDKAWETSTWRKLAIAILTYFTVVSFFVVAALPSPFVNAIVPTMGYLLSTLSLSFLKKLWLARQ